MFHQLWKLLTELIGASLNILNVIYAYIKDSRDVADNTKISLKQTQGKVKAFETVYTQLERKNTQ